MATVASQWCRDQDSSASRGHRNAVVPYFARARHIALAGLAIFIMLKATVSAQERPSLQLEHIQQSPVIDGDLSDACWETCKPVPFVRLPNGDKPRFATFARVGTDGTWLFVAYDCHDPQLKATDNLTYRVDTPVPGGDAVELFVDPGTRMNVDVREIGS